MLHVALAALMAVQDGNADLAAELKQLTADYQKAEAEYRKAGKRDPANHPAGTFIPKFNDLAKRAAGTDTGAQALLQVLRIAGRNNRKKEAGEAVDALLSRCLDSVVLLDLANELRWATPSLDRDRCIAALRTVVEKSPHKDVKAAALFNLALSLLDRKEGKEEARKILETLQKDHSNTPYAKDAEGYLFEMDNLQVGKVAPDFEATDQDGTSFKLSDYRGKVVIVDFWGFW